MEGIRQIHIPLFIYSNDRTVHGLEKRGSEERIVGEIQKSNESKWNSADSGLIKFENTEQSKARKFQHPLSNWMDDLSTLAGHVPTLIFTREV
jgi:hypothetical protein